MDNYTKKIENQGLWWKVGKNDCQYCSTAVDLDGKKYTIVIFNNSEGKLRNNRAPDLKLNVNRIEE